jgi:hypothetical protein
MDDLDYDNHLRFYKNLFGYDNPDANKARILRVAKEQAKHQHALSIISPLRDQLYALTSLAQQLTDKNAKYYMLYGAARRANLIFGAYRGILSIVHEDRTAPLSPDEQITLNQDIQSIYIHMLGLVDNFAWCILYETHVELADTFKLTPTRVGLFSDQFKKQCMPPTLADEIHQAHGIWDKEVRDRRNPIAHRIPPYVPSAVLTSDESLTHTNFINQFWNSLNNSNPTEAGLSLIQTDSLGTFYPYFVYHPDEPPIPIYPTIPTDLSHVINIGKTVSEYLRRKEINPPIHTEA